MTKQLTVQNATITTAAVAVKTLTISGKQVTLAVFRQLREEPLIATDGTLNGTPWGYVNYHPDKCGDDPAHRHVVWQRGDELLRSAVQEVPDFDRRSISSGKHLPAHAFHSGSVDHFLTAMVYTELSSGGTVSLPTKSSYGGTEHKADVLLDQTVTGPIDFVVWATAAEEAMIAANLGVAADSAQRTTDAMGHTAGAPWLDKVQEARAKYEAALESLRALIEEWGGHDEIRSAFGDALREESARRQKQRDVRVELAELPQLFIAV